MVPTQSERVHWPARENQAHARRSADYSMPRMNGPTGRQAGNEFRGQRAPFPKLVPRTTHENQLDGVAQLVRVSARLADRR